jgi:F-type H+-transporting ATPase subunit b
MLLAASFTDPNFALSFWTAVTFALLIVVMGKFAWGPILAMLETREKTIAEAIESAKRERAEAEKAATEMRLTLDKVRAEAAELTRKNQQEIAAAKAALMAEAKRESEELLVQARKSIQEERRQAIAELRNLAVDLAIEAAGRLLQTQMDASKQRQLVEEYLANLAKERRV